MQAENELAEDNKKASQFTWDLARENAIAAAKQLIKHGAHKQIANRIIEPWCHINTVLSSTEWSNFFALRCHPAAQPEMRALADAIFKAMADSNPKLLMPGQWHLPYVSKDDEIRIREYRKGEEDADVYSTTTDESRLIQLSVARCARVSYLTQEGKKPTIGEDLKLYNRLVGQIPLHASPAEHAATPDHPTVYKGEWMKPHLHGNYNGWIQHRKTIPGECQ